MNKNFNVPNVLSFYRILALPFIFYTIYSSQKSLFITLISVNLISDILDGYIARKFKLETEIGARLDSLADIGTYLGAFAGMIILENKFVSEHSVSFTGIISLYISVQIIALIRFKRTTSFHLFSSKILGYIQGIFIFTYFVVGYNLWYFYFMIILSIITYSEALIIVIFIPQLRSNVKGLYFILKEYKKII